MVNTLKIKVFGKSISFSKYLCKESLDLHEILCAGRLLSCELKFLFHEDPCINSGPKVVNVHRHVLSRVPVFMTRASAFVLESS